ncbi:low choriolytic enzyme-like [Thalassophryne amazonica]|uniref:low choriolytic enzyme-like n=1 Tax=Thalassophryne amazonica TaxID=390379 RepID=UPI0014717CD1|nr:low choriolytic enzyme-like [Thalassophryne amazonica]
MAVIMFQAALLSFLFCSVQSHSIPDSFEEVEEHSCNSIEDEDVSVSTLLERANNNVERGLDEPPVVEGDIAIPTGLQNADQCTQRGCLWPKSRDGNVYVPYRISNQYSTRERNTIITGLRSFAESTCIRFTPQSREQDFVDIQSRSGCYSYISITTARDKGRIKTSQVWEHALVPRAAASMTHQDHHCCWMATAQSDNQSKGKMKCIICSVEQVIGCMLHSSTTYFEIEKPLGRAYGVMMSLQPECRGPQKLEKAMFHLAAFFWLPSFWRSFYLKYFSWPNSTLHGEWVWVVLTQQPSDLDTGLANTLPTSITGQIPMKQTFLCVCDSPAGLEGQFQKKNTRNLDTPYDYGSVMHYGRYTFSRNRQPTIVPIPDNDVAIGRATQMSPVDIVRVNRLYSCNSTAQKPQW